MITEQPQDCRVLFLDMNCFFARVEQQVQPAYRGRPIGVAPYTGDSGCIIAASYEAKAQGIKTGFRVGEAKKQCPSLIVLPSRPALYYFYHQELVRVLNTFSPFVKTLSVDEFAIKLTGRDREKNHAVQMAFTIKEAIRSRIGDWLTCSIGLGPNQFLAKLAGEMKKPDGLFEIKLADLKSIYHSLQLTDLCGINYGLAHRCRARGIYYPLDLYHLSLAELNQLFGISGKVWYFRLRGYEMDDNISSTKSINHSHVLPPELRTSQGARQILIKLIGKVGYRLRQQGYWAAGFSLYVRFIGQPSWHKYNRTTPFQDNRTFLNHILALWEECRHDCLGCQPLLLAVSVSALIRQSAIPLPLFPESRRQEKLSRALDIINDRYGASTIYPAVLHGATTAAPDRISFGQPRFEIRNQ